MKNYWFYNKPEFMSTLPGKQEPQVKIFTSFDELSEVHWRRLAADEAVVLRRLRGVALTSLLTEAQADTYAEAIQAEMADDAEREERERNRARIRVAKEIIETQEELEALLLEQEELDEESTP
jgi:hypothetical protein